MPKLLLAKFGEDILNTADQVEDFQYGGCDF